MTIPYQQPVNRRRLIPAAILVLASFVLPDAERLYRLAEITGTPIEWLLSAGRPMMDSTGRPMMTSTGQPRQADGASDDCCCVGPGNCVNCTVDKGSYTVTLAGVSMATSCQTDGVDGYKITAGAGVINGTYTVSQTTPGSGQCVWHYNLLLDQGDTWDLSEYSATTCSGSPFLTYSNQRFSILISVTGSINIQARFGAAGGAGTDRRKIFEYIDTWSLDHCFDAISPVNNQLAAWSSTEGTWGWGGTMTIS